MWSGYVQRMHNLQCFPRALAGIDESAVWQQYSDRVCALTRTCDLMYVPCISCVSAMRAYSAGMQEGTSAPARQWSCNTLAEGIPLLSQTAMVTDGASDLAAKIKATYCFNGEGSYALYFHTLHKS